MDKQLAAQEALDWLDTLGVVITDALKAMALQVVTEEASLAEAVARLLLTNQAVALVESVKSAIATGDIPDRWDRTDRYQELVTTGLTRYDPRIAFQATLRTAYSAGRYTRAMEVADTEPYFVYRTMRDGRVRDSHAALNGVALPKSHEFWKTHYPPNGWRCRCKAYSIDDDGLARLEKAGLSISREAPEEATVAYTDKTTGDVVRLPESIEPGFDFLPADQPERLATLLAGRLAYLAGNNG